jgi:hypothetical protein
MRVLITFRDHTLWLRYSLLLPAIFWVIIVPNKVKIHIFHLRFALSRNLIADYRKAETSADRPNR